MAAFTLMSLMALGSVAQGAPAKEEDLDVNYDESKVLPYALPPLLVTSEGKQVTTPEEWRNVRRPEILGLFSEVLYGRVPALQSPIKTDYEVLKTDPETLQGKATRKQIRIHFQNDQGEAEMMILIMVPNKVDKPVPALMMHSFENTRFPGYREGQADPSKLSNGIPMGDILDRGYAFVAVYQQDLAAHNEVEFNKGIAPLFYGKGQSFPRAYEWGVLSIVAWGGMRALDYLETDKDIDSSRVAIMGHSKMGKAALWTAAQDERFALAVSAQSGCAGAALWRRNVGETLEKMVSRFPYWLCRNAWKFARNEDDLPVDQHMLIALMAPRPVYVYSATDDKWADPRGEYLSAYHASEVYRLLGKKGLEDEASPREGKAMLDGEVGYHVRKGGHSVELEDWKNILDFADRNLKK